MEYLVTTGKKRNKKQRRKRASKTVFNVPSKLDIEKIEFLLENIDTLKGKIVKKNDILNIEDIKLKVKSTTPDEEVVISKSTKLEFPFTPRKISSDIILAIESSYGMNRKDYEPNRFIAGLDAIKTFLDKKAKSTAKDEVGLIDFGYDWELISDFESPKEELNEKLIEVLKSKKLSGRASVGGAITGAIEMFELHESKNLRYLIILTDGIDNVGTDPISCAYNARDEGIIIYVVLIGKKDDEKLKTIAEITNGYYYVAETKEKLNKLYSNFASKLGICLSLENKVEIGKEEIKFEIEEENPNEDEVVILVDKPPPKRKKPKRVQGITGVTIKWYKKIWKWLW